MAQIDPSIALSFRPIQIESPINQMSAIAQLQGAQQQQQMNALKLQEYQQQQQERNELARIMSDPNLTYGSDAFMNQVLARAPGQFEPIATRVAQRENLLSQREAREAEVEKRRYEAEKLKGQLSKEQFQTAVSELTGFNTIKDVKANLQQKLAAGQITKEQADQVSAGLPKTDAEVPAWQIRTMRNLLTPKEKMEDIRAEKKDVREAARLKLEDDRIQEQIRHANAMEEIGRAGADRAKLQAEETARHNKAMERLRAIEVSKPPASENPNKVASTSTDDQGNVTFYNAFGQKIRTETNAGKRSPNLIKAEQAEKNLGRDIERTSRELADIVKDGGLIDQSTGSGAGRLVDLGARFIGEAMPGDIAASNLAPIADMVLKMVPRFEGPQSDKDTTSYNRAAGQLADPSLPNKIRKEAGKTILRLMQERKNQFATGDMDMSPNQRKAAPPPPAGFVPDKK
jgi:hypothetical protein